MLHSSVRKQMEVVKLPGEPDHYAEVRGLLAVSPDGRWILYHRRDGSGASIMLVENFR
jgi:hypothetical protein